jgi:GT2 family glycosyltransferase
MQQEPPFSADITADALSRRRLVVAPSSSDDLNALMLAGVAGFLDWARRVGGAPRTVIVDPEYRLPGSLRSRLGLSAAPTVIGGGDWPPVDQTIGREVVWLQHAARDLLGWLRANPGGPVIVPDLSGVGYFPVLARRQGWTLADTPIEVLRIGPARAHDHAHFRYPGLSELGLYHAEAEVARMADATWRLDRAGVAPGAAADRRELLCLSASGDSAELDWLIRVVQRLDDAAKARVSGVTLARLGASPSRGQRQAGLRLAGLLDVGITFRALKSLEPPPDLGPALAVLASHGPDAAILADLVADWDVPQAMRASPWAATLAAPDQTLPEPPAAAAEALAALLAGTPAPAVARAGWVYEPASTPAPAPSADPAPLVSVCVSHFNRPETLRQTVASLEGQSYPDFEVVICDDGSTAPEAVAYLAELEARLPADRWRIVRQPNRYLGAARNTAARHARGTFLLFMDDDNIARPDMIARFVTAARGVGADVVTCFCDVFQEVRDDRPVTLRQRLFMGAVPSLSPVFNVFGDANAMIRKSTFEAVGGFTEDYGIGHEDWEFFLKTALSGARFTVVPDSLFDYRVAAGSMIATTQTERNLFRSMRPFLEAESGLGAFALFAQGQYFGFDRLPVPVAQDGATPAGQGGAGRLRGRVRRLAGRPLRLVRTVLHNPRRLAGPARALLWTARQRWRRLIRRR